MTARLVTAIDIYGSGIRALQLVHADDRGHWPWDVGYRGRQAVLGVRASPSAIVAEGSCTPVANAASAR
jgi:hypothetical protein